MDSFLSRKGVKTHKRGISKNFERRRMERWGKTLPPMIDKPHRGHVGQIKDRYGGMTGWRDLRLDSPRLSQPSLGFGQLGIAESRSLQQHTESSYAINFIKTEEHKNIP